jgi:hypothetical protein
MIPSDGFLFSGAGQYEDYQFVSGPASFGGGGLTSAISTSGPPVAIFGDLHIVDVPAGYISGTPLSDNSLYSGSFASLGLVQGTYTWTWGTGMDADSFTLQIGPASVPDAGSTLPLLGFASLGLVALRRKLRC